MKIREMPSFSRPDERALKYGTGILSDAELIAVILRTGTKGKSSVDLANEVLRIDKGREGLGNLCLCGVEDYKKISGLGTVKALQLSCVFELSRRAAATRTTRNVVFDMPSKVADFYMESFRYLEAEEVSALFTDTHMRLIRTELIAKGGIDSAAVEPRQIIKKALSCNAAAITVVHNHPSGVAAPSDEDIQFTRKLKDACLLMDLKLSDSIIIGDGVYYSMYQQGML